MEKLYRERTHGVKVASPTPHTRYVRCPGQAYGIVLRRVLCKAWREQCCFAVCGEDLAVPLPGITPLTAAMDTLACWYCIRRRYGSRRALTLAYCGTRTLRASRSSLPPLRSPSLPLSPSPAPAPSPSPSPSLFLSSPLALQLPLFFLRVLAALTCSFGAALQIAAALSKSWFLVQAQLPHYELSAIRLCALRYAPTRSLGTDLLYGATRWRVRPSAPSAPLLPASAP
eukprot:3056011-Rhodomonas_salina.1